MLPTNLNDIGISVINAYLAKLMYAVILLCFSEQLWIIRCAIAMSGDDEVNLSVTPANTKIFQSPIGTLTV